ncbi:hypothetical protein MNBD_BACTEROID01-1947 [hydrothermal vent metagenome]|uniref:Glycosyl hydrolase, BNR repeat n=1 Tax=hydrothermal vent metagenome TaxID=652676 RepID=A0A3B0UBX4_9ZZZZ
MQKLIILTMFLLVCASSIRAQNLKELLSDKKKTFKEIEYELNKNEEYLKKASEKERKMYERWRWFWNSRVDSSGSFEKYNVEMNKYFNQIYPDGVVKNEPMLKSASTLSWSCLGPSTRPSGSNDQIGRGRLKCIWVDPVNFNHILVGANSGGLWKTTNGGINWNCLTNNTMTGGVFDIAVNPNNNNNIYIVTGLKLLPRGTIGMSGNYSLGIFKSTNGGSSWAKLNITTSADEYFDRILIHPTNSAILYALSNFKVYKSTNAGSSWSTTSLTLASDEELRDMVFKPNEPNTIYVSGKNAIYRTTDAASSWTDLSANMNGPFTNSLFVIAVNPNDNDDLYALYCDLDYTGYYLNRPNKVEKTNNGGSTWQVINSDLLSGVPWAIKISLSPNGDIYAGGVNLKKSTNDGATFSPVMNSSIHVDFMDITFPDPDDNDLIYLNNDGGVYMDDDGGASWTRITGDLATNEFYSIAITEQNPEIMVGGTHDCGTYYRDNSGVYTHQWPGGDGGTSLVDHSNPSTFYFTANTTLFRTENGTKTSIGSMPFLDAPLCMDPTNSNILYKHKWQTGNPPVHLKKSTNKGSSWTTIDQAWDHVREIVICDSNTDYMYYSMWDPWADSEIRRTVDGGANWDYVDYTDISSIRQIAPINSIYVHPFNPKKVWIVFGGFEEDDKIFYSKDGGDNWTNITGSNLPNIPIQCFEYDFLNQTMFVGTDVGIYYREMDDNDWTYSSGFPRAIVSSLNLNKLSGDLVVSTYGRGVWRANLGEGYCYDSTPLNINSNTTWSTDNEVCSDVNVNSGYTLKVTADIVMSFKSVITIKSGGTLKIDGGKIKNGSIVAEDGGELIIKNNGRVKLNNTILEVENGATMDFPYGEIDIKQ